MTSSVGLLLLLFLCAAVLAWFFRRPRAAERDGPSSDSAIDLDALEEAEAEVQDLDAFLSPDDAGDELTDWGPGAPKS